MKIFRIVVHICANWQWNPGKCLVRFCEVYTKCVVSCFPPSCQKDENHSLSQPRTVLRARSQPRADLRVKNVMNPERSFVLNMSWTQSWPSCLTCHEPRADLRVKHAINTELTSVLNMSWTRAVLRVKHVMNPELSFVLNMSWAQSGPSC